VLALQRTVGNRAVGAMLARDAKAAEAEPMDAKAPAGAGAHIALGELGKIALESIAPPGGGAVGSGGSGSAELKFDQLNLTSRTGDHSAKLGEAMAKGKHFESAVIDAGRVVYRMTDVIVSSLVHSGSGDGKDASGMESWSISFAKLSYEYREAKAE